MKRLHVKRAACILAAILLCMAGAGFRFGILNHIIRASGAVPEMDRSGSFQMTMLDVGQGLALFFEIDGRYMMYDGGGRDSSSFVVSRLKQRDVKNISCLIASHYDEDHIAGLIGVLKTTQVESVISPDYTADSKIYSSFISAEEDSGAEIIHPSPGDQFEIGNASLQVLSADNTAEDENDRSVAVRIVYGAFSIIITGDASWAEEDKILGSGYEVDSDVCIAGHHGSRYSASSGFLSAVSPDYTLISCGRGNEYGHPSSEALGRIRDAGSSIFRTDMQGSITLSSDGTDFWFSQDPCGDWSPGIPADQTGLPSGKNQKQTEDPGQKDPAPVPSASQGSHSADGGSPSAVTYIVNTNTGVFHRPDCSSVRQMADHNKMEYSGVRDDLIRMGFSPCQICSP